MEVRREQRGLVAPSAGADLDDGVAIVEWVARNQCRLQLLLDRGYGPRQPILFGARLTCQLGVVNENELANLRELVLVLPQPGRRLHHRRQAAVFSPKLGESLRVAMRAGIRECPLDLVGARQHFGELIAERQSSASAPLLLLVKA